MRVAVGKDISTGLRVFGISSTKRNGSRVWMISFWNLYLMFIPKDATLEA